MTVDEFKAVKEEFIKKVEKALQTLYPTREAKVMLRTIRSPDGTITHNYNVQADSFLHAASGRRRLLQTR